MRRRPRRAMAHMNVVPYIDVMLVLLVIFMVAAPMLQPGLVNLPNVSHADKQISAKPLYVSIAKNETIRIMDGDYKDVVADDKEMLNLVKSRVGAEQRPVVVAGDRDVRYAVVMNVMSVLKEGGVERVGLAVEPKK
ncbi:biopolymer transporter ExbD [Burkholderiaceae bacterium DAT-1]|nr:biopolymer transporter ExbD [Burkholderiaceae bacterium DAT-1]